MKNGIKFSALVLSSAMIFMSGCGGGGGSSASGGQGVVNTLTDSIKVTVTKPVTKSTSNAVMSEGSYTASAENVTFSADAV